MIRQIVTVPDTKTILITQYEISVMEFTL